MWKGSYVLEVVEFITEKENLVNDYGKYKHVGYMKISFKTKKECCDYYDINNPHMRKLNTLGTYISDWNPKTKLLYIVRKDYMLIKTINPF